MKRHTTTAAVLFAAAAAWVTACDVRVLLGNSADATDAQAGDDRDTVADVAAAPDESSGDDRVMVADVAAAPDEANGDDLGSAPDDTGSAPTTSSVGSSSGSSGRSTGSDSGAASDAGPGPEAGSFCTGNTMMCGGTRTDVGCDPANCGTCGHSCLGGDCQGGICQVLVVASNEAAPGVITVDPSGGAYWANQGTDQKGYADGAIRHIALASTTPDTFAANVQAPQSAISDGTTVFFSTEGTLADGGPLSSGDGQLLACPTTGCQGAATVIAAHQYGSFVLRLSPSSIYWNNGGGSFINNGVVTPIDANLFMSALKTGGGLTSTSGAGPFAINSSATFISPHQNIDEAPLDGGTETVLYATPIVSVDAIEADSSAVYWIDDHSSIQVCQLPSCTNVTTLVQVSQGTSIEALASDATNLYWLTSGPTPAVSGVFSCAKASCTPQQLVGAPGGYSLAVAPEAVYWTQAFMVMRWAR